VSLGSLKAAIAKIRSENDHAESDTRRLPLWKDLLDRMIEAGLEENKSWPIQFFVEGISAPENSVQLSMGIHEIRRALRRKGWVLTSRGSNGSQFYLTPRGENAGEMIRLQNLALNSLREGVILGTCTPLDALSDSERQRHEAVLEKLAKRAVLMGRRIPQLQAPIQTK
jgi:hypothetical protein